MFKRKNEYDAVEEKPGPLNIIWGWVKTIVLALLAALVIKSSVVEAYSIPSGSMLSTLQLGDQLLINKAAYRITVPFTDMVVMQTGAVERGDVVVFDPPFESKWPYIKRVVGLPGDTVAIVDKQVTVGGQALKEPYVQHLDNMIMGPRSHRDQLPPTKVPPGKLFVMGDNRDHSEDSRFWGFADIEQVRGRAMVIYWSWDWERMRPRLGRLGTLID